jgi:hypothetical protein
MIPGTGGSFMKSTRVLALSASLVLTALTHSAFAKQISISDRSVVRSCDISTIGKLTKNETAQLEAKGYRVNKERSKFHHERFLGVYEYYELKDAAAQTGTLYLNAILSPDPKQRNSFGPDVTMISRREFRLMVGTGKFESVLQIATSKPSRVATNETELKNADFSSFPNCHD